jgi:rRNA-processing protein FCF1
MVPLRFGVDVKAELARLFDVPLETCVTSATLDELHKLLVDAKPGDAREFNFALKYAKLCTLVEDLLQGGEQVDDQLFRLSSEYVIATTDSDLRRRIREKGHPVVYLRQENRLALDGSSI